MWLIVGLFGLGDISTTTADMLVAIMMMSREEPVQCCTPLFVGMMLRWSPQRANAMIDTKMIQMDNLPGRSSTCTAVPGGTISSTHLCLLLLMVSIFSTRNKFTQIFFLGCLVVILSLTLKDLALVGGEQEGQAPVFREESLSASRCHLLKNIFVILSFQRRLEKVENIKIQPQ